MTKVKLLVNNSEQEFDFEHAERILKLQIKQGIQEFTLPTDTEFEFDGNLRKRKQNKPAEA